MVGEARGSRMAAGVAVEVQDGEGAAVGRAVSETQSDGVALNSPSGEEFMFDGGITVGKGENAGDSVTREQPVTTQRHPANPRATRMDAAVVNRTGLRDFWAIARERFPTLQYSCMPFD